MTKRYSHAEISNNNKITKPMRWCQVVLARFVLGLVLDFNLGKRASTKGKGILMKKYTSIITCLAVAFMFGLATSSKAQIATNDYYGQIGAPSGSGGTTGCPGAYVDYTLMTNSVGSHLITPPSGVTSVTLYNNTGVTNLCALSVLQKPGFVSWCSTNGVLTFPVSSSYSYTIGIYVKTPPVDTNATYTVRAVWY